MQRHLLVHFVLNLSTDFFFEPQESGHDGKLKGRKYFKCPPKCGVLVSSRSVKLLPDSSRKKRPVSSMAAMVSARPDKPGTSLGLSGTRANGARPSTASSDSQAKKKPESPTRPKTAVMSAREIAHAQAVGSVDAPKSSAHSQAGQTREDASFRSPDDSLTRPVSSSQKSSSRSGNVSHSTTMSSKGAEHVAQRRVSSAAKDSRKKGIAPVSSRQSLTRPKAAPTQSEPNKNEGDRRTSTKSTRPPQVPVDSRRPRTGPDVDPDSANDVDTPETPPPVGVAALDVVSQSPRLKRRTLPLAGKPPSPSDWQQRKKGTSDKNTPKPPQRSSPKMPPRDGDDRAQDRVDMYAHQHPGG